MGYAPAADLFFCILVSIIHGIWDRLSVHKGFETYGGWGEAWKLPIDARAYILIDLL